jgi:two-component system alkaline phosphatase synthesis response regulator PhoP
VVFLCDFREVNTKFPIFGEMKRILIVDDDQDIRELLKYNLEKEGYLCDTAEDGLEALESIKREKPSLILLDVMMPRMDGIQVCEVIREKKEYNDIMIAFLTARSEDYSQIAGLQAGSDDYIPKPIKPNLLISRIHALFRRNTLANNPIVENNPIRLKVDYEKHLVYMDDQVLQLPRKEFDLLALLVSKPQVVFQREHILNTVWGTDVVVGDRTIDVHIRKIREKIGEGWIHTVKGVGYKFVNK